MNLNLSDKIKGLTNYRLVKNTGVLRNQFANWQVVVEEGKIMLVVGVSCIRPYELGSGREVSKWVTGNYRGESFCGRLKRVAYKMFVNDGRGFRSLRVVFICTS